MARVFLYQYDGDSGTRDRVSVIDDTPVPQMGEWVERSNQSWIVEVVTPVTTNGIITEYVID